MQRHVNVYRAAGGGLSDTASRRGSRRATATAACVTLVAVLVAAAVAPVDAGPVQFIHGGSVWKYWDGATAPPSTWKNRDFDDSDWASGASKLGYNEKDLATTIKNQAVTTYFRKLVSIPNAADYTWALRGYIDDGAVVYANGVEIWRFNMKTGTILATDPALAVVVVTSEVLLKGPMGVATTAMTSADGLVMIAVELHQAAADKDKDAHLALQLEGTPTTRLATTVAAWTSDVVVEKASTWKYLYDGKFPVDWRLTLPGFNDATWKSGKAQLGYGETDEATKIIRVATFAFITFRITFTATAADIAKCTLLSAELIADDGAVAWVNGVESSRRDNVREGLALSSTTFALVARDSAATENVFGTPMYWGCDSLVLGTNALTVMVFQNSPASPDLSFDATLSVLSAGPPASPSVSRSPSALPPSATASSGSSASPTASGDAVVGSPSASPSPDWVNWEVSESPTASRTPAATSGTRTASATRTVSVSGVTRSPSAAPTSQPPSNAIAGGTSGSDAELTTGAKAGIAVMVIVVVAVAVIGAVVFLRRRRRQAAGGPSGSAAHGGGGGGGSSDYAKLSSALKSGSKSKSTGSATPVEPLTTPERSRGRERDAASGRSVGVTPSSDRKALLGSTTSSRHSVDACVIITAGAADGAASPPEVHAAAVPEQSPPPAAGKAKPSRRSSKDRATSRDKSRHKQPVAVASPPQTSGDPRSQEARSPSGSAVPSASGSRDRAQQQQAAGNSGTSNGAGSGSGATNAVMAFVAPSESDAARRHTSRSRSRSPRGERREYVDGSGSRSHHRHSRHGRSSSRHGHRSASRSKRSEHRVLPLPPPPPGMGDLGVGVGDDLQDGSETVILDQLEDMSRQIRKYKKRLKESRRRRRQSEGSHSRPTSPSAQGVPMMPVVALPPPPMHASGAASPRPRPLSPRVASRSPRGSQRSPRVPPLYADAELMDSGSNATSMDAQAPHPMAVMYPPPGSFPYPYAMPGMPMMAMGGYPQYPQMPLVMGMPGDDSGAGANVMGVYPAMWPQSQVQVHGGGRASPARIGVSGGVPRAQSPRASRRASSPGSNPGARARSPTAMPWFA